MAAVLFTAICFAHQGRSKARGPYPHKARRTSSLPHTTPRTDIGSRKARRTRLLISRENAQSKVNNGFDPFTWLQLEKLFRRDATDGFIPSSDPNLRLFRRSSTEQESYERHKDFLRR